MTAIQIAPCLNTGPSSNFFGKEYLKCTQKYILVQKSLQMGKTWVFYS